ncbi:MAG: DNA-processing protein DprA [Clostridia bacterium]|nr:DNA-processing protein DprA [Clostridia bacterium]
MYNKNEKALIWLTIFESLTYQKVCKLLSLYKEPITIFENLIKDKTEIKKIVGEDSYQKMITTDKSLLENYITNLTEKNIKCLTILSEEYPEKLKNIEESPIVLFCKGDISLLKEKSIAIVGTRNPTAYARGVTEDFAKKLGRKGLVVISGLASGVDKIAHEQTLAVDGKTIAVLGGGFDTIYPAMNTNLAKQIEEKGLLISEYKPNLKPTVYSFPFRNRIIAGLSDGVLITEAGEKSGSLHTKNYALEFGKDLFVVPGNINNFRCQGSNRIIKNMQGACVTEVEDIYIRYGLALGEEKIKPVQTDLNETIILSALEDGEQTLENLQEITKLETKTLNSCLTMMQIRGLIKKLPGNTFAI